MVRVYKKTVSYPVHIVTWRNLEQDVLDAVQGKYHKYTIQFFAKNSKTQEKSMMKRQCTADYKIKPVTEKNKRIVRVQKR